MKKDKLYLKSLKLAIKMAEATKGHSDILGKFEILELANNIYNDAKIRI